jgi:hypothetical protein
MAQSTLLLAVIAANALACLSCMACTFRLRSHLRANHPLVWSRFGYPRNSPFVSSDDEKKAEIHSDFRLSAYLRSGEWQTLGDARLAKLIYARRIAVYAACLTLLCGMVAIALES